MVSRDTLINVFKDTIQQCETHPVLKHYIATAIEGTAVHNPSVCVPPLGRPKYVHTDVEVNNLRTFESANQYKGSRVAVLNFANATTPGGGVWWGSKAQEESLCRCSTLYPVLNTPANHQLFYEDSGDIRYTDKVLYTPNILVFKTDTLNAQTLDQSQWYSVDVLTCAAPNLTNPKIAVSDAELYGIHVKRAVYILSVAAIHHAQVVILGAFGCGAFHNNPQIVAQAYRSVVPYFNHYFQKIVFSVYDPQKSQNFSVFQQILSKH